MAKQIAGTEYDNGKLIGVTISGINDGFDETVNFRRITNARWIKNNNIPTYKYTQWSESVLSNIAINVLLPIYYDCSECGESISDRYGLFPYCPHCGARMENWGR